MTNLNFPMDTIVNQNNKINTVRLKEKCNLKKTVQQRLPILSWLPNYTLSLVAQDLLAGFTVGLTEIPQGIAYAAVAGLPLQYGLYSGFMGCFVYFFFGSVKDINLGPTAILALMIQPVATKMGPDAAVLLAFTSGCIIILFGLLRLGFLVDFFSYPVIAGFTSAAALNTASSQIKSLLGIPGKSGSFLETWQSVIENIYFVRKWDVILGVVTLTCLIITKELAKFGSLKYEQGLSKQQNRIKRCIFFFSLARNALAVIVGAVIAYNLDGSSNGENPFKITGVVQGGLPEFKPPPFQAEYNGTVYDFGQIISQFSATILFCPLIAVLEAVAIAKVFTKGKNLDGNQEMIALGLANILGSFVSSMPITGSLTRTAVNNASGVRTTAGGIITGIMVLLSLSFLTSAFYYIPKATLAAIVICAMLYLFEFKAFVLFWRTKKLDLVPFLITLLTGSLISLEYGILIGIVTNISFVLYATSRPKIEINNYHSQSGKVLVASPKNNLHFPAAAHFMDTVLNECCDSNSTIVIDGTNVSNMDATVAKSIHSLVSELNLRKLNIILWNFKPSTLQTCLGMDPKLEKYFKEGDLVTIINGRYITVDVDGSKI